MTVAVENGTRRWFLRSVAGAALTMVTIGAQGLFGVRAASAQSGPLCCLLTATETLWCPLLCAEQDGWHIRCWSCNGFKCKCCECVEGNSCFSFAMCSYKIGCCYYENE